MSLVLRSTARLGRRAAVRRLPVVLLALAALGALAGVLDPQVPLSSWLAAIAPLDLLDATPVLAGLSIIASVAIVVGLLRHKRSSWWLAVATFAAALFVEGATLADPLESVVLGGALAILIADRHRYRVEMRASWRPWLKAFGLVAGLAVVAETGLIIAATGHWPPPLAVLSDVTSAIGNLFGVDDTAADRVLGLAGRGGLVAALLFAARLPMALSALGVLARIPETAPDPSVRSAVRSIAARHGRGALLPFQLGDDKLLFCPPGADACVVYGLAGRTAVALGDPIAAGAEAVVVFDAFLERSRTLDRSVAVYQASDGFRSTLVATGFHVLRIGREAIIELPTFDLAGSRRANLRHTITRALRGGGRVGWYPDGLTGPDGAQLIDGIVAVDRAWRAHAGPPMGFTVGELELEDVQRLPVAVASEADGRAVAFATFRPTGSDGGWVLDLMRRIPAGTPGMLEWCIAEAALGLKSTGARTLSLGLAPLDGLDHRHGPIGERLLACAGRLARHWYDARGLAFFKAKFDPAWEPRYAAVVSPWAVPGMAAAVLRLHLRRSHAHRSTGGLG